MERKFDFISVGDASLDVFLRPMESNVLCQVNTKDCLICFSYGDKIPVKSLNFSVGGNAANNSVGTTRLGIRTMIVLTVGDDNVGGEIVDKLRKEGVDLTYVVQQPGTNSNYSVVVNYATERTIFVYHAPRSYEFPVQLPVTTWAYLTSMGESFRPFYNHFSDWLAKNPGIKLAFNPGTWQLRSGVATLEPILKKTHVIFVNREEAEGLTNFEHTEGKPEKDKELLVALSSLGPKVSIITDGENGSLAYDGEKYLKVGILPIDAFQRTGAGDAFGSGCLAALIKGKPLEEALLWGTANSASVIGYPGPQKGLLRKEEMQEWMERCKSSGVEVKEI